MPASHKLCLGAKSNFAPALPKISSPVDEWAFLCAGVFGSAGLSVIFNTLWHFLPHIIKLVRFSLKFYYNRQFLKKKTSAVIDRKKSRSRATLVYKSTRASALGDVTTRVGLYLDCLFSGIHSFFIRIFFRARVNIRTFWTIVKYSLKNTIFLSIFMCRVKMWKYS